MLFSKFLHLFLSGFLISVFCSSSAKSQQATTPPGPPGPPGAYSNVKRDSLLNGLQVVSLQSDGEKSVKVDIVLRAGAMFDLAGKTGIARLTQETLLAINPRLKEELESLQAMATWGVDWDTTWFRIETPANNFDTALETVARLLVVENIRADAFKRAQQELIEKIINGRPSPAERADESFLKALYGDHPYGHNVDGSEASVTAIKQGDVYDFLRRFYIANNSSIVVVGDIPHVRVMKAFKVFFGGWVKGQLVPATFRPPRQVAQLSLVKVEAADAQNVELRGGVLGVKHADPDFLTTEVMARVLTARLKKDYEITVRAMPRVLAGPFFYSTSVNADQAPAISRRLTESFTALAKTAVSGEELAAAKASLTNDHSARSVEDNLREIEVYSLPKNYPLNVTKKIETITVTDVQRVAKRLLDANALTVVVLGKVNENFN